KWPEIRYAGLTICCSYSKQLSSFHGLLCTVGKCRLNHGKIAFHITVFAELGNQLAIHLLALANLQLPNEFIPHLFQFCRFPFLALVENPNQGIADLDFYRPRQASDL